MAIEEFWVSGLRNLCETTLYPAKRLNWITGSNGAGKTSLLEAIYLLGNGRSFRTSTSERLIQDGVSSFSVSAAVATASAQTHRIGLKRNRDGSAQLRVDGTDERRLSSLVALCPVQVLEPDSYSFLSGPPKQRRRFLDWGVFHVEHDFADISSRYTRLLAQRNACLKLGRSELELDSWDQQLIPIGEGLNALRARYWAELIDLINTRLQRALFEVVVDLDYYRGWAAEFDGLDQALKANRDRDRAAGTTGSGPHRADIRAKVGRISAHERLSRGQTRLAVQAIYLAQLDCVLNAHQRNGVLLLDDVGSELDEDRLERLLTEALAHPTLQVFVTSTHSGPESLLKRYNARTFHVERGVVTQVPPTDGNE